MGGFRVNPRSCVAVAALCGAIAMLEGCQAWSASVPWGFWGFDSPTPHFLLCFCCISALFLFSERRCSAPWLEMHGAEVLYRILVAVWESQGKKAQKGDSNRCVVISCPPSILSHVCTPR